MLLRYRSARLQCTHIIRSPVQCNPHFMVEKGAQSSEVTCLNLVLQKPSSQSCYSRSLTHCSSSQASAGPSSCVGHLSRRRLTGSVGLVPMEIGAGPLPVPVRAVPLESVRCKLGGGPGEGLGHRGGVSTCALRPFQRLHDLVLPLVMGVQQGEVLGSSPYTSSRCRRELYRLLLALLLAPSPRCPPPLACALQAFSLGQREDNLEVTADGPSPSL